jgi:hypothetical protein
MTTSDTARREALKVQIYSTLSSSYLWLFRTARVEGSWGQVRSTALAGLCLTYREPKGAPWRDGVLQWLARQQGDMGPGEEGCWGEELWDTSMAVIALIRLGMHPSDPVIQKALRWQIKLYNLNGNLNWHDEPWETAWTVLALLDAGEGRYDRGEALLATQWLMNLQDDTGRIVAPHYTAYFLQIYSRLRALVGHDQRFEQVAGRAISYLVEDFDPDRLWTGEAWSNGQILWSFLMAGTLEELGTDRLRAIVHWFTRQQDGEGSWRRDVEDTASAILGLHRLVRELERTTLVNETEVDNLVCRTLRNELHTPPFPSHRRRWHRDPEDKTVTLKLFPEDQKIAAASVLVISTISLVITFWQQLSDLWRAVLELFR